MKLFLLLERLRFIQLVQVISFCFEELFCHEETDFNMSLVPYWKWSLEIFKHIFVKITEVWHCLIAVSVSGQLLDSTNYQMVYLLLKPCVS